MEKRGKKGLFCLVFSLGLIISFVHVAQAKPVVIRFTHASPSATYVRWQWAEKFKELTEKRFPGRVEVKIFPGGQLYKDAEGPEAARLGSVEMAAAGDPVFTRYDKAFGITWMPGLFPNNETVKAFAKSKNGGKALLKHLQKSGLKGVSAFYAGGITFFAKKPIRTLKDFKGLKLRIPSGDVNAAMAKRLGFSGIAMAGSEIYMALKQGVVDGLFTTPAGWVSYKWVEIANYAVDSNFCYFLNVTVANLEFWNRLPKDVSQTLEEEIIPKVDDYCIKFVDNADRKLKAKSESLGGKWVKPSKEELHKWVTLLLPITDEHGKKINKDLIAEAKRLAKMH